MQLKTMRTELRRQLTELAAAGLAVYIVNTDHSGYGYIVTKNDNVLSVGESYGGWNFTLNYVPSNGLGCGTTCNEFPPSGQLAIPLGCFTIDDIPVLERRGMINACKFGATLYKSSDDFFDKLWNRDKLEKL